VAPITRTVATRAASTVPTTSQSHSRREEGGGGAYGMPGGGQAGGGPLGEMDGGGGGSMSTPMLRPADPGSCPHAVTRSIAVHSGQLAYGVGSGTYAMPVGCPNPIITGWMNPVVRSTVPMKPGTPESLGASV
jgi:hypothetical protein